MLHSPRLRRRRWLAVALATTVLTASSTPPVARGASSRRPPEPLPEYSIKAAFLIQFFNFVRWPDSPAVPLPTQTSRIGILGEDPFGDLFRTVEGTAVAGRRLEVKRFRSVKELEPCHILFIASSEEAHVASVLAALGRASTLTVGESPAFIRDGGMIRFYNRGDRIRLEMNAATAERVGLKPSAKLVDLAQPPDAAAAPGRQP